MAQDSQPTAAQARDGDTRAKLALMKLYGRAVQALAWLLLLLLMVQLMRSLQIPLRFLVRLFMGTHAIQQESLAEMLGQNLGTFATAMAIGAVGAYLLVHGRRVFARAQLAEHVAAHHAPVVYLRSFAGDTLLARRPVALGRLFALRTEEEQLAAALAEIGPAVAIGRPGELLPRLGARRLYLADNVWQAQVLDWFSRAALVVIQCPAVPTQGVAWELEHALDLVPPQRLAFLLPGGVPARAWLGARLRSKGWPALPAPLATHSPYGSPVNCVVHFGPDRSPRLQPLRKPTFWRRPYTMPMQSVYRLAFAPVAQAMGKPLKVGGLGFGDAGVLLFGAALLGSAAAVTLDIRAGLTPLAEAQIQARNDVLSHPGVPQALRREGGVGEFYAWAGPRIRAGMARVPDALVLGQWQRYRKALAEADVAECAALARGGEAHERYFPVLLERAAAKDPKLLQSWMGARMDMLRAELDARQPVWRLERSALQSAYAELLARMPVQDRARFNGMSGKVAQAGDEAACWFAKQMMDGVRALPAPHQAVLARVMLEQPVSP